MEKDVLIIGGGPAGLSGSIWCSDLGLSHFVFEKEDSTGGQLHKIFNPITNYPGIEKITAGDLEEDFADQAKARGGEMRIRSSVVSLDADRMVVELDSGDRIHAKAIVLATGVRRRRLDLPGEADLAGILESGAKQAVETSNARVAIVGGGDAAFENALILAKYASTVTIIHHSDKFRARAEFLDPARSNSKIEIVRNAVVKELFGDNGRLKEIVLGGRDGERRIETDYLLVRIGVVPNSELVNGSAKLDAKGYIKTDANCETNLPMVFAVGDVAAPLSPTIATAVGQAATAIKVIKTRLARS